jgi:hypothetical protein
VISVAPAEDGWAVRADGREGPMVFRSGAEAEEAARRLAESLADEGHAATINFYLKDGTLGGRFICPPKLPGLGVEPVVWLEPMQVGPDPSGPAPA